MTAPAQGAGALFDLAIIGGGINGCGIALEATKRGLRVALFEQDDLGFGTTWRSTKLIHGGLRYLEHGDVRLVFESLRERKRLLEERPHLVHAQRLLLPMLPWTRRPAWQLRAGLLLYDTLAIGGGLPRHRWLKPEAIESTAPFLPPETDGGFAFYDARARAPERLAIEMAREAAENGALVMNHARVTRVATGAKGVEGVEVEHAGATWSFAARAVLNAAGPWVDAVNAAAGVDTPPLLGTTRGTHIVLECDYPASDAVFSTAKSDGRVLFAVPQADLLLVGTTDIRDAGDPGAVHPTAAEVDYLLDEAQTLLPGVRPARKDIRYAYAGLRPLQRARGGPEAAIPRQHEVIDHGERGGPAGLYSVIGGKLSTYRPVAEELLAMLGADDLVGPRPREAAFDWQRALANSGFDTATQTRLTNYGPALEQILREPGLVSDSPHMLAGEVRHAVEHEFATTLADVLLRRSGVGWLAERGLGCHRDVAAHMGELLGWDEAERERQVVEYEREVRFHLPTLDDIQDSA